MKVCIGNWLSKGTGSGEKVCTEFANACFDGLKLWQKGPWAFIEEIVKRAEAKEKTLACYLNAHTYHLACRDEDYRTILSEAEILYPDGMSIVWAARLLCGVKLERMTAVDFFDRFMQVSHHQGLRLYFFGGRPGVAASAAEFFKEKIPEIQIVGTHHGYVDEKTQADEVLTDIQASGADILLVGLGSPQQEKFVRRHRQDIGTAVIWTVGALFDYFAGEEKAAPRWMGRMGLEWLYRLYRDPAGKWRRYVIGNLWFAGRVIRMLLRRVHRS